MSSGNSVGGQQKNLNWLLDDLVSRVAHVKSAIVLSRDGLTVGASEGLARDDAEHLSALAAGVQSLARGTGKHVGGGEVRQTIIEMEKAFLFVTNAGKGSCLAVLAGADADVGIIAYEMAVLVKRVGHHLASPPRSASGETSAE